MTHDNVTDIVEPRTHYTLEYLHSENYSGEHREWVENIKIPIGNKLVAEIQGEAADTIAKLRKQLENAWEALNKADSALRGGRAIIVNQLPHAPWLRTMDEAIEAISALKGQPD